MARLLRKRLRSSRSSYVSARFLSRRELIKTKVPVRSGVPQVPVLRLASISALEVAV